MAVSKFGVPVIPAKPLHIAVFISELAKHSSENNISVASIESAIHTIKWGHAMASVEACPVSHPVPEEGLPNLFSLRSHCRNLEYAITRMGIEIAEKNMRLKEKEDFQQITECLEKANKETER